MTAIAITLYLLGAISAFGEERYGENEPLDYSIFKAVGWPVSAVLATIYVGHIVLFERKDGSR